MNIAFHIDLSLFVCGFRQFHITLDHAPVSIFLVFSFLPTPHLFYIPHPIPSLKVQLLTIVATYFPMFG